MLHIVPLLLLFVNFLLLFYFYLLHSKHFVAILILVHLNYSDGHPDDFQKLYRGRDRYEGTAASAAQPWLFPTKNRR